jgi:hypothetical protein
LHWHLHVHTLVTCGAFTAEGELLEVPEFDMDRLRATWQAAAADGNVPSPVSIPARCSQTWAMLIKRVYEIAPLAYWIPMVESVLL